MLLGLAGITLPVLAHLLSRKNYDVVEWGAMQFLELKQAARRRIHLEHILLMLLRMGLIAFIVFALARPWASGGFLTKMVSSQSRDVVFIIDGSLSMGWEGKETTPHAKAIQWIHKTLEVMRPGDTVTILDAREQVHPLLQSPTRNFDRVREALEEIPPPAGASYLAQAVQQGVQILSTTSNLSREIIVLTDGQAYGWQVDDDNFWSVHRALLEQPAVAPQTWVVNVSEIPSGGIANFHVGELVLNREYTVPNFPIQIQTTISYNGGTEPITRRVYLEINGQRLKEKTITINLHPGGEQTVEFEHRLKTNGTNVLSVVLDADPIPGDNRSDAAVEITSALPVLIINGDPQSDPAKDETFFVLPALTPLASATPWVQANVIRWDRITAEDLKKVEVVILANVPRIDETVATLLTNFVRRGGGLLIAPGNLVEPGFYNRMLSTPKHPLLPAKFDSIKKDNSQILSGVRLLDSSLKLPWLERFKQEQQGDFPDVRFSKWWKLDVLQPIAEGGNEEGIEKELNDSIFSETKPVVIAELGIPTPLMVTKNVGRGRVLQLAVPIDADWSTLPTKHDFVTFLHEAVFYLAKGKTVRNLHVGTPIVVPVSSNFSTKTDHFQNPAQKELSPIVTGDDIETFARLDETTLPGVYYLIQKNNSTNNKQALQKQSFVLNYDHKESNFTPLSDVEKETLSENGNLQFIQTQKQLQEEWLTDQSRAEFWHILLLLFLVILVAEVYMTRRLVQGGHAVVDEKVKLTNH
ncbi:hypothetical protein MNBD_PLANCTO02-2860 [hydrothermal vent metagenome]|uniref:VWFA domain-containing protein n=1 Tax=hydrothermal vent metagenome TaxID=652676 RepID=A0A3B1DFQ4_9ZZZZ